MVALARSYARGPVSLGEIARDEGISSNYLEQLVSRLRKAGLVEATRGAHGGYHLAAGPSSITVGQVLRVLDGPIAPIECASEDENAGLCDRATECPSKAMWERVRDNIARVVDTTTLADLCAGIEVQT